MARNKQKNKEKRQSFDATALANLTAKLDKSLDKPADDPRAGKRKRQDGTNGPLPKKRQVQTETAEKGPNGAKEKKHSGKLSTSQLLDEIRALGGDEEDLELVTGIDSDAEEGGAKGKPTEATLKPSFKDELAKFASTLGFQNLPSNDDVQTDDEEDAEEPEAEDGAGVEEEEDDEEEPEPEPEPEPAPIQEPQRGKKPEKSEKSGKLVFETRADWYAVSTEWFPTPTSDDVKPYSGALASLKTYAKTLLEEDASIYKASQARNTSSQKFMSTIMTSGTLSDKVSALTLAIQESPVHNIRTFESLVTLASKKSRGQAIAALGALVDLLGNGMVLPNDRRLRLFNSQPALIGTLQKFEVKKWTANDRLPGKVTKRHLIMWAYEDWLKDAYFRIVQVLEMWCGDEIEYSRSKALDFVFGLLKDKPEQEANLLRLLVNKLGDRDRKIASRASYCLLQLLNLHPGMKAIVIKMLEQELLLRPGQSVRTRYYAINTLNQTILSSKEPEIADTLVRIYFETFMALLKTGSLGSLGYTGIETQGEKAGKRERKRKSANSQGNSQAAEPSGTEQESSEKLVSAVLTGVNRAIPFALTDDSTLEKHLDTLFKITHSSNFNTSVQALMLIQQLASTKHLAVDRYYRTLYESLLDPRLSTSSKQALYLNLLFRSLKNDVDVRRVKAFVKRMIQVLTLHQPSFACGILFLVAELQGTFPDLKTLLTEPEVHEEDEEEVYKDVGDEGAVNGAAAEPEGEPTTKNAYDGRKRNPEYSNAQRSCLWELGPFFSHFHPSVAIFASNLLVRQKSLPKPELANHTLMHFLDKFVYRNPKSSETSRGGSIMQPLLGAGSSSHIVSSGKDNAKRQSVVNSASFWNLKPEQVAAEDIFFHEYFAQMGKPGQPTKTKKERKSDETASDDEEAEEEIWDALVSSRPEIGGEEDDDSDLDMEGYDDSEDEDLDLDGDEDAPGMGEGSDDGFEGIFGDSDEEEDGSEDEEEEEEEGGEGESTALEGKPRKGRLNRKEMRALPMFASVDDYAEMLEGEEDGMDGQ